MTQEEKAKRYDEALERAKKLQETCDSTAVVGWCEYIFPELKESEDERTRKAILTGLIDCRYAPDLGWSYFGGINIDECIAWLEKQSEQSVEPKWCHHKVDLSDCSEEYRRAYYDGWNNCNMQYSQYKSELDDVTKCLINGMKFYYEGNKEATWGTDKWSMPVKHIIEVLEKQSEQTHATKTSGQELEQKFHPGDWIIDNEYGEVLKVAKADANSYEITTQDGEAFEILKEDVECNHRLWAIADAKDGDVLATPNYIYIFNSVEKETETVSFYCLMKKSGEHFSFGDCKIHDEIMDSIPATKEQRDLLFQKMKEAGWEWDAEKKEANKIEYKTLEPDEVIMWIRKYWPFKCWGNVTLLADDAIEKFKKDFEV